MSAFVVEDQTINRAVAGICRFYRDLPDGKYVVRAVTELGYNLWTDAERLAMDLFDLNVAGVVERYGQESADEMWGADWFTYEEDTEGCSVVQLFKSIECLLYQCAEGEVVKRPLYIALERVSLEIAGHMIRRTRAWEQAKWA